MANSTESESESVTGINDVDLGVGVSSGIEDDQLQAQEPNYQYYYLNPNQNHTAQITESTINTTTTPTTIPIPTPPTLSPTKSISKIKNFNQTGESSIWMKLGALAWMTAIVAWLYVHHQYEEERARRLERRRQRRREEAMKKKILEPNLRRSVIAKCVSTRIMKEEDLRGFAAPRSNDDCEIDNDRNNTYFNFYGSAGSSSNDNHFSECPVCLDPFLPGEALSWSKSFNCHHIFHSGCINPWIMTSDECPCCRAPFFQESDFIEAMKGDKGDSCGGGVEGEGRTRIRAETFTSECSGEEDDYITDDDMMDHGGKGGSFRVVNGLIEFVKTLSPSKTTTSGEDINIRDNSGDIYGPEIDEEQLHIHGDTGLNFAKVEMISMVTQSNTHDDNQDDADNNTSGTHHENQYEYTSKHRNKKKGKRKEKRLNKKRYNSLFNTGSDSSDHDNNDDNNMDSSHYDRHFGIDEDDGGQFEEFDDDQGVKSHV